MKVQGVIRFVSPLVFSYFINYRTLFSYLHVFLNFYNNYQGRVDVLTNAMDDVVGQITKANVAIKTCHRYALSKKYFYDMKVKAQCLT